MAVYYLDASAIVKRYRTERGTDVIDELLNRPVSTDRFYSSYLIVLEVTSAILRLTAGAQLTPLASQRTLAQFSRDLEQLIQLWPLDAQAIAQAVEVVTQYLLRSADAIHLATALQIADLTDLRATVMVSSDQELAAAAERAGLKVVNPEAVDAMSILANIRQGS